MYNLAWMLYRLLKPIARLAIIVCFKNIQVNKKELLQSKGPLLLACNHPNSFLDAILLCVLFDQPVYSLARGDVFKKKWVAKILKALKMFPVYREREGVENLSLNYNTFHKCLEIFKQNGIVLIFSEALCINEWHLRPVKKGTAKLAVLAWQENIPVSILPVGLNYSSFKKMGKVVQVNLGNIITQNDITTHITQNGKAANELTQGIQQQLVQLVYEIDSKDASSLKKYFSTAISPLKKALLLIPAAVGFILHSPFYYGISSFLYRKTKHTGHYDSIMMALIFFGYPILILLYAALAYFFLNGWWSCSCFLILPFSAWSYIQVKK